jgi:hypothetical protein
LEEARLKPGDHPEFFRWPPPEGTSRESTLRLDRDGQFWHDGERVERPRLSRALHAWVGRHPDDGRPILTNGYDWCYLAVDDTLRFVASIGEHDGALWASLLDGRSMPIVPTSIAVDEDGVCFVRLRDDPDVARFTRVAMTQLEPWLVDTDGGPALALGNALIPIRSRSEVQ